MSLDADSIRLRTIAAAVISGDCPREEYLAERRRLLDLHAGEQTPPGPVALSPAPESDTRPQPALTAPVPVMPPEQPGGDETVRGDSRRDLYLGIGAVVVVLALLWGLLAWAW